MIRWRHSGRALRLYGLGAGLILLAVLLLYVAPLASVVLAPIGTAVGLTAMWLGRPERKQKSTK